MKWTFDHLAKIVAALSFGLVATTTIHDWGFFLVVGSKFQSIQTTYDHLANALDWLPQLLIINGIAFVGSHLSSKMTAGRARSEFGFEGQYRRYTRRRFQIAAGIFALAGIFFIVVSGFDSYPSNLANIAVGFLSLVCSATAISFFYYDRAFIGVTIFGFFVFIFAYGTDDGVRSIRSPSVYRLNFRDGETKQVSLLRSFEKGVLVWSPVENRVEFFRWEQVDEVSRRYAVEPPTGCRILSWFCREEPEP